MCELTNGFIPTKLPREELEAIIKDVGGDRTGNEIYEIPVSAGFSLKQTLKIRLQDFVFGLGGLPSSLPKLVLIPFANYRPVVFATQHTGPGYLRIDGDVAVTNPMLRFSSAFCSEEQTPAQRQFLHNLAERVRSSVAEAEAGQDYAHQSKPF